MMYSFKVSSFKVKNKMDGHLETSFSGETKFYKNNSSENSLTSSITSVATDRFGFMNSNSDLNHTEQMPDVKTLRRREKKWLKMLSSPHNWNLYATTHYKKVRSRCRKGIPSSIRPQAWFHLCGAGALQKGQTTFEHLYKQEGDRKWISAIEKDLDRNFPTHELFGGEFGHIGKAELAKILKAYSIYNPVIGYCQAQAPIASLLLMYMPSQEAFWCFENICDHILKGYYSEGMAAIQADGEVLFSLLKVYCIDVYDHLKDQDIQPIFFMQTWFQCAYARTFPMPTVLRIWDMFMCEGIYVLFRVGLVILKFTLTKRTREKCSDSIDTLSALQNLTNDITNEIFLVKNMIAIDITDEYIKKERCKQLKRFVDSKKTESVSCIKP